MPPDPIVLGGGSTNVGEVVRIGDTVRRPREPGAGLVEAFLVHLERVGYSAAPRFLGQDAEGRQVLTFVGGDVTPDPGWLYDDAENARQLGRVAAVLRDLHTVGASFLPPAGEEPRRPLPIAGPVWNHGDAHYGNVVYRAGRPVALLDWDFVARGDALYDPVSLLIGARLPRLDRPAERADRERSAHGALEAILDGYEATDEQRAAAPGIAAAFFDGAADYLAELGAERAGGRTADGVEPIVANRRFVAGWWRSHVTPRR